MRLFAVLPTMMIAGAIALTSLPVLADAGHGKMGQGKMGQGMMGEDHAYGRPGDPKQPARAVSITMRESEGKMVFIPDRIEVRRGEQIRFVLRNDGALEHEFVLGTEDENMKHMMQMEKNPDMEHDDPNAIRLKPGASGEIVWRFTKAGIFDVACLFPGHRQLGMFGSVAVK